ncbi:class I SAM-dependent methyltransferase [Streptomyces gamaensis]|uniref:Class I SAM-dependent methyltransferase n=1 Tax=Streptomyces gamaensis TaxID=1763542 RepID=A0ABW0YYK7_9ACTN
MPALPTAAAPGLLAPDTVRLAGPAGPPWLPGLESVAPEDPEGPWLQAALLGPYSADILGHLAVARSTGGPVLDLGAGGGRLSVPFARHGFEVDAVDRDAPSLLRLEAWAARCGDAVRRCVTAVHTDLAALRLRRRYRFVLLAGAMVSAVPPRARAELLALLARHLHPQGALALDYAEHAPEQLAERPCRTWRFEVPRVDGVRETATARQVFDPVALTEHIAYRSQCLSADGSLRQTLLTTDKWIVEPGALRADLARAGLRVVSSARQRLDASTSGVLLVCRT